MKVEKTFPIVLAVIIGFGAAQGQQPPVPPVMLQAPVRPMQPPFTPVPPTTPVYRHDNSSSAGKLTVNDPDIQTRVNNLFRTDKLLRHIGIHVTVQNGVAIL